jgi:hypothetical protein
LQSLRPVRRVAGSLDIGTIKGCTLNYFVGDQGCNCEDFGFQHYSKAADISQPGPSDLIVFVDHHEDSIHSGTFLALMPMWSDEWWADLPASHHESGGVFSFSDGHVAAKRWLDPRTIRIPERKIVGEQYSPNNPDLAWLRAHCTIRYSQRL